MEAFRRQGILPRDVRTVSEESLAWNTPDDPTPKWLPDILKGVDLGWDRSLKGSVIYQLNEGNRWRMWMALKKVFASHPDALADLGLLPDMPRYNHNGEIEKKADGATTFEVFSVRPARRVAPDGGFRTEVVAVIQQRQPKPLDGRDMKNGWFWFRGGATLILDARKGHEEIRYSIVKDISSNNRLERQRGTAAGGFLSPLRGLYFGNSVDEPFALIHASGG
jgi:hypothetical protein